MREILERIRTVIENEGLSAEICAPIGKTEQYRAFFEPRTRYFTRSIVVRYWCDTSYAALLEWSDRYLALAEINEQIASFDRVQESIAMGDIKPRCLYCDKEAYTGLFTVECDCITKKAP